MPRTTAFALAACTLAAALAVALVARPAAAQSAAPPPPSFHVGVTWSDMDVDAVPYSVLADEKIVVPSVVAGWRGARGLLLEGRVGRLRAKAWETWGVLDIPATFVSTEALLAEARLGWAPPRWAMGPAQPHVALGVLAARVRDGLRSDTPIEYERRTYPGVTASAGGDLHVAGPVALRLEASYRRVFGRDERAGLRYGLDGRALELGVLLRR